MLVRRRHLSAAVALAVLASVAPVYADDAAAKALFDEGKTLFAEGKYGEACAKLEASFKLSAMSSTRGLLGACYEKVGKLASAWAAYRDSAAIADRQGHAERAQAAREKATELEAKLAHLAIDSTAAKTVTGLEVTIDGVVQPTAALDTPLPIDAGPHVIAADARGYTKWSTTIDIVDGEKQQAVVPMLVADPKELDEATVEHSMSKRRKIALAVTGGGVAVLGVGAVFGILAKVNWNSSNCDDNGVCPDADAKKKADAAARDANIATVLGVAGLAIAGAGVVMFVVAPKYESPVTPAVTSTSVSLVVQGRF